MKVLLLAPSFYTLANTLIKGFNQLGFQVYYYDYRSQTKNWKNKVNTQMFRLPYTFRNKWENYFMTEINRRYTEVFEKEKPDIVFIYNNEMLLPKTLQYFKNTAKIIFIMGDNPYYTPTNDYYMHLLFDADLIISPDSFWADQLKLLGIKNIIVDFPGYDEEPYKNITITEHDRQKYNFDILFVGTGYTNAWGYKRALFLNHFTQFNFKLYGGRHFIKWFQFFPELEKKFELKKGHIPIEELVKMHQCAKLYPVDANPAILHGLHLRVFDCIAMGVLPLVEYRKDHDLFFEKVYLPLIKNYNDIETLTKKLLSHDDMREKILKDLREYCQKEFSAKISLKRSLDKI